MSKTRETCEKHARNMRVYPALDYTAPAPSSPSLKKIKKIQYYNMSYSESEDSEGNCGSFSVGDDEGESIDSITDGDTKSDGDESAASESAASLSDSPWVLCPEL